MEQDLKIGFAAEHIMAIAVSRDVLKRDLFQLAEREVLDASTCTYLVIVEERVFSHAYM